MNTSTVVYTLCIACVAQACSNCGLPIPFTILGNRAMEKIRKIKKDHLANLPQTSGVYLFYGIGKSNKEILYIGKAINLRERVKNHFSQPSYRDNLFINQVTRIGFINTNSEIEALLLEAALIKKHIPKFNVVWRDDKNYFYVAVAQNKEHIPYVFITHQPVDAIGSFEHTRQYIGPFVEGNALKKTLKFLRRVFPYYTAPQHPKRKCTWCHLDLCPGPNLFEKKPTLPNSEPADLITEYKKNIKKLALILQGKKKDAIGSLKKEMAGFSRTQEYEKAARTRNKINALTRVIEHAHVFEANQLLAQGATWDKTQQTLGQIIGNKKRIVRIECYDISNIQGKSATGSMVVFENGLPSKGQYKKFKIRIKQEPNDIAMLKEVLERRFSHKDWLMPQVILIDGGIAQLNIAMNTSNKPKRVTVISIAKGRQELFIQGKKSPIPLKKLPQDVYNLIKHLDDEAHRFAISYHKLLRSKKIMS